MLSVPRRILTSFSLRGGTHTRAAHIMCTDKVDKVCVDIFKSRGHSVDLVPTMKEEELIKSIGNYDGLVVRSATKVTEGVLAAARRLQIVGRAGVGVDNINISAATKNGVLVMNTPNGNTVSTAQLALSLLMNMARKIPLANMDVKKGEWNPKNFSGREVDGKTIGIVGCGRIGQVVADCSRSMGMRVVGFDPVMSAEQMSEVGIEKRTLTDIWTLSDFITFHTPLTSETSNLLNEETIALCKPGVCVVNCARGGIIDEAALLKGLNSGHIAAAALDVYTSEPPREHLHELISHPNLVCTPHLGASTEEAQSKVAVDIAHQMCDVFDQKDFVGVLNVPYIAQSTQAHMKPFMRLAEMMGSLLAQISDSKIVGVSLQSAGGKDVKITTKTARQLLEAKVLQGILKKDYGMEPDMISAPGMAKESNISSTIVDEEITHHNQYLNLVSVKITREDGTETTAMGSVFGTEPHIVRIDSYKFTFKPEGNYVLSFKNEDKAGAVLEALKVLHSENVNVASINVARDESSEENKAITCISLDNNISAKGMKMLRDMPALSSVAKIQLN